MFIYLPLIPRLKALAANKSSAGRMRYRAQEHQHEPGTMKDVMDSASYCSLLTRHVVVDGKTLSHKFFEDGRDVALGLSTDSFGPFKRRTKTVWPLILFNYNLPPEIRFHLEHVIGLSVIPGPKKPTNFDSFLRPLIHELLRLEVGVHAYDTLSTEFFVLCAYLILVFGDIPAMSMVMRMKEHNGATPCWMCSISAIRVPGSHAPTHYVLLDRHRHPDVQASDDAIRAYDPAALPTRTHDEFLCRAREVQFADSEAASKRLAKRYGIKGIPALSVLSSLSFPGSFPYDFMHLLWENIIKKLMNLWSDQYKELNKGTETYQFPAHIWEEIGAASAASGSTILYIFGARPPNVASDKMSWSAELRLFWFLYGAPVVLRGRFTRPKYYEHLVELVRLIKLCLQFDISDEDIVSIESGFIKWVKDYEE